MRDTRIDYTEKTGDSEWMTRLAKMAAKESKERLAVKEPF